MLKMLKKLFTPKPKLAAEKTLNLDLILKLNELKEYDNLNSLFFSPISKIMIINTYTNNFNDLSSNLYNPNFQRNSLIAINIYSYFNNNSVDFHDQLSKLIEHLSSIKISTYIEHDLYELANTFVELLKMENPDV